jgi:multidrug efflux pump subunit AcrB
VIRIFAEHRVAANLLMIMMTLAGIWAIRSMPTQLDPPSSYPLVLVEIQWPGASAEDMESLVTTPIEQALRAMNDLRELRSRTEQGTMIVQAEFHFDADMTLALDQVKQRVSNVRNLPSGIEPPVVGRFVRMEPVTILQVTGDREVGELIPIVRALERDIINRGIESVTYDGLPKEEIALLVGGQRLREIRLTLDELATEVARVSGDVPAGTVGSGQGSRQLRSLDQRRDAYSFEQLLIGSNDQLVRFSDIGQVERRPQRGQPIVTKAGKPAIEMTLWRSTSADAYLADRIVTGWLDDIRNTLPEGVHIDVVQDIWTMLGGQLDMIVKNGLSGLILVALILFVFLSGRVGWWVMIGIPVSFLLALAVFHMVFGHGISIIALIGLVMALGIVVDDAIVVGEDAAALYQAGASATDAAIGGAQRMWVPVATSSLTTMAAFIPLVLVGGIMGNVILVLPTVLLCVIAASLVECFLVLPAHLRGSLGKTRPPQPDSWRSRFDAGLARFTDVRFMPLVRRALDYPGATLCAALGGMAIALSLIASQHVGVAMVTGFDFESLEVNMSFSATATDADQERFLAHLEEQLEKVTDEVGHENLLGWVIKRNLARFNNDRMIGEQYASIRANYAYEEERTLSPQDFINRWRAQIVKPAYVEQLVVAVGGGQNNGQPDLTLVLRGDDIEALKQGAEELAGAIATFPGVSNVIDNLPYGKDQIIFEMTAAGRTLGLTSDAIGRQLRAAYSGRRVQIFNENDSELEVRVMLPDHERDDLGRLQQFPVRTPSGEFVSLGSVATLYNRRGIDVIRHNNGQMAVAVSADVDPQQNNAMALTGRIEKEVLPAILARYDLRYELGGKSEADKVIMSTMALGAVLTLVLIYLILTWVFASYLWPMAIMVAIPFGLTGAVFGHWVTGWDIGAMSFLAFFSLTGVVVNDSIVLISFFKRNLEAGEPLRQALERAVRARFRAVILTSLTTIGGLSPLMFETSTLAFYVAPIAVTLCFGLAFATGLVLLVIPALILLLEAGRNRLGGFVTRLPLARRASAALGHAEQNSTAYSSGASS